MDQLRVEVEDLRAVQRFAIHTPLDALFTGVTVALIDLSERGAQAEHATPMKVGTEGKLAFSPPGQRKTIELPGVITWSRLSKKADRTGKLLYRTGFMFDEPFDVARLALEQLVVMQVAKVDNDSLERKKQLLAEKARERASRPTMKPIVVRAPERNPDEILLIQHAHDQLRSHPEEASKWYNRAKFSLNAAGAQLRYREDILATWEYLGRTIDLARIAEVFEKK